MRTSLVCSIGVSLVMSYTSMASEQRTLLPEPEYEGDVAVEEALRERRSVREFSRDSLALEHVSQLLWAAQGVTGKRGFRAAPSAGALYPLELYVVAGDIDGLAPGVYHYRSSGHDLVLVESGDRRRQLARAALDQDWVRRAPAVLVITGVYSRTTGKYGQRGRRYVHMEVGHAAQNVYLQATARGLGTVMVGAFEASEVRAAMGIPGDHEALGLMPLGHKR